MHYGDTIEYELSAGVWKRGIFVGINPLDPKCGVHMTASGFVSERKLNRIRKPKVKKEGWVNVYAHSSGVSVCGGFIFSNERDARNCLSRIATVKIEWEE